MPRLFLLLALAAGLVAVADQARAATCVMTHNGVVCYEGGQPYFEQRNYGHRIRPHWDDDWRDRRHHRRSYRHNSDPNAGCPRGFTRQDGRCKPYRGY